MRIFRAIVFVSAIFAVHGLIASDVSAESTGNPTSDYATRIRFSNGDVLVGELTESDLDYSIGLKLPQFTEPFFCSLDLIRTVDFISKEPADGSPAAFKIELSNEDTIEGEILEWTQDRAVISTEKFGKVELATEYVRSIVSAGQRPKLLFRSPSDESAWSMLDKGRVFHIETGSLVTKQRAAKARIDAKLPDKCIVDLQLSWEKRPSFVLNFAAEKNDNATTGFLLETIEGEFGILREYQGRAQLNYVAPIDNDAKTAKFRVYLNQREGFFGVRQDNQSFASITLPIEDQAIRPHFQIENYGQELRLDSFQVIEWDGSVPPNFGGNSDASMIEDDGVVLYDQIESYDPEKREVTFSVDGDQKTESIDELSFTARKPKLIEFQTNKDGSDETKKRDDRKYHLFVMCDGFERFTGVWQGLQEGKLTIQPEWSMRPIGLPLESLTSVTGDPKLDSVKPQNRLGTMMIDDLEIPGCLVNATADDENSASCLHWQPRVSLNAAPVRNDQDGEISYQRKVTTRRNNAITQQRLRAIQLAAVRASQTETSDDSAALRSKYRIPSGLQLRSGDLVGSENVEYRNGKLFFESPNTKVTSIDEADIQSVRFYAQRNRVKLSQGKIERLLTVPRANQSDPPTHMLIARNGDYLRGRLMSLDSENAVFEVRHSELVIPRKVISSIVWLHDRNWSLTKNATSPDSNDDAEKGQDEIKPEEPPKNLADSPSRFAVHMTGGSDSRMTFFPVKFEKTFLIGDSPLLEKCKKTITTASTIIFGPNAEESARELHGNPWVLELATLPVVYSESDGSSGESPDGPSSLGDHPLVGKEAPNFRLKNLDDENVTLNDLRGKIVVIDFWASWCGPCIQALPKVHSVVAEYQEDEITLLAVNIEESAERAGPAAGRLGLAKHQVLLDSNGGTSMEYQATAIPQTVIVDAKGIIRAVFVGGSRSLEADLKAAIDRCRPSDAEDDNAAAE